MSKDGSNTNVWTVTTLPDLGMTEIYLSEERLHHILLGHRDLRNVIQHVVKETVENPTSVNLSRYGRGRMVFTSANIQSARGKSMGVVVEREDSRGKVITATQMTLPRRDLVWESAGSVYSSYDRDSDVFYVSKGGAQEAYVNDPEQEAGLWFRQSVDDDSPVGVTVFMFEHNWNPGRLHELAEQIAKFLFVLPSEIEARMKSALSTAQGR